LSAIGGAQRLRIDRPAAFEIGKQRGDGKILNQDTEQALAWI